MRVCGHLREAAMGHCFTVTALHDDWAAESGPGSEVLRLTHCVLEGTPPLTRPRCLPCRRVGAGVCQSAAEGRRIAV